ncbi:hypothetical protein BVRB_6g129940 [Beta vulgaris subsp. vulgaris]|nr:hypothetical protein BVRB_6g129940 [Beta vulgaris subsp. vulgaris]
MSNSGEVEAQIPATNNFPATEVKVPEEKPEVETKGRKREKKQKSSMEKKHKAPSHPPYFQMIKEAILALNEKGGSSPYAIAKFMEQKHKTVLPSNFRKILGLQLKNSVSKGKLIKVKASYKLSEAGKKRSEKGSKSRSSSSSTTKAARANAAKEPTKRRRPKSKSVSKIDNPPVNPAITARRSKRSKPKQKLLKTIKKKANA